MESLPQVVELLFEIADQKYPHYKVSNVEIIASEENGYRYRVEVMSNISPKWKMWMDWCNIESDVIIRELRDRNLQIILED